MSVNVTQYIGYGYYLDYYEAHDLIDQKHKESEDVLDMYRDSHHNSNIVDVGGFSVVDDLMDAEFLFFGRIIDKGTEESPISTQLLSTPTDLQDQLESAAIKLFGCVPDAEPSLVFITNYS